MASDAPPLDAPGVIDTRLPAEVSRRRTFAIISHPDAGKTTLTEKLLLYAGAIELAGAVRGRKTQRHAVSDWMDVERERGISVTSAALDFDLRNCHITLLDTPGHQDFSEDTYRTLYAVDSAVMVIDAAKGIESQTRKLFEVARLRHLPLITFVNKLDLPGRDPFELLQEIEDVLGIHAAPLNWPIGSGDRFRGVFDLVTQETRLYEQVPGGGYRAPVHTTTAADPQLVELLGESLHETLVNDTALIAGAGTTFDRAEYLAGRQTPVFFGSALDNFGLEAILDALETLAPPPQPRETDDGGVIPPVAPGVSGFVFKIQANMNRKHRDRVAFVRICSGVFEKDMALVNARDGATRARGPALPLLRRPARDRGARLSRRRRRPAQPGQVRHRRHALRRRARCATRRCRVSRPSTSAGCGCSTPRSKQFDTGVDPARGGRPDPGRLPRARPARADSGRRRPAAARGRRGPAEAGVQRRVQGRPDLLRRAALGEVRPEAAVGPREPLHRHPAGRGPRRAAGAAVRVASGA